MTTDHEPFAEAATSDGSAWFVTIGRSNLVASDRDFAIRRAAAINAAVEARERKAAAKALRDAADSFRASDDDRVMVRQWLRWRADAVEKGTDHG